MARISSGSSEGAGGAVRLLDEAGKSRPSPSDAVSASGRVCCGPRRILELGVIEMEECMSPRRFLGVRGVLGTAGLLQHVKLTRKENGIHRTKERKVDPSQLKIP